MSGGLVEVTYNPVAREFQEIVTGRQERIGGRWIGFFVIGNREPGVTKTTTIYYDRGGRPYFEGKTGLLDRTAIDIFQGIPGSVDPDRAERSAIVATYRVSDGTWWMACAFGDDAAWLEISPTTLFEVAEQLSPV